MTLPEKIQRVRDLGQIIGLSADRLLPAAAREAIENEQFRLEFALKTLNDEFREREAGIRIKHMEKVVEILKEPT